jgi:GNAT superfamily N-acetyltransferase
MAVLGGASTLPEFRRRGVQTALQHARLTFAAGAGCDLATTITQPGSASQRNAERRGFHVIYTRVKFLKEWPRVKKRGSS